jgi:hypothetical protein
METSDDDLPAINTYIVWSQMIWYYQCERRPTSLTLDIKSIKLWFRGCQITRIMCFQSRQLSIEFPKRAVGWTGNVNYSPVQSAADCGYENSVPRGGCPNSRATNAIPWWARPEKRYNKTKQRTGENCCTIASHSLGSTSLNNESIHSCHDPQKKCRYEKCSAATSHSATTASLAGDSDWKYSTSRA